PRHRRHATGRRRHPAVALEAGAGTVTAATDRNRAGVRIPGHGLRQGRGLRRRLVWSMLAVLIVALTAVGVVSVLLVDRSLRARLTGEALATTEFNLAVLAPAAGISAGSNSDEIAASGVLDRFLDRGPTGVWVEFDDGSRLAQGDTQAPISGDLRRIADRGEIAYQFSETPGGLALVTAARLPGGGPTYFFVTPATTLVDTVRQVALVVGAAGL